MKILVTGANGQLGQEVTKLLENKNIDFVALDKNKLDITSKEKVFQILLEEKPEVILHCAAYTSVDAAEDEGNELNYLINATGGRNIALGAKEIDATVVYISTDYVFDGQEVTDGYTETNRLSPINEYGKAKLLGEKEIVNILDKYFIIRTSWVFGEFGNNFVFTMLKLAETHKELSVVNDQIGRPTWTRSLAEFMLYLIDTNQPYGVYHFSNDETCSWYEFSREILKDRQISIQAVSSEKFPQKAKRPSFSVMNLNKAKSTGFEILDWRTALDRFMEGT